MKHFFLTLCFLLQVVSSMYAQISSCDTVRYYFDVDLSSVDPGTLSSALSAKGFSDDLLQRTSLTVKILGYTDCPGTKADNLDLSLRRARQIKVFFNSRNYSGVTVSRCEGKGEWRCGDEENSYDPASRRVDIILCKGTGGNLPAPVVTRQEEPKVIEPLVEEVTEPKAKTLDNMSDLKPNETLVLDGLNFYPGSHQPVREAKPVLEKLFSIMQENPTLTIEIQGHVCCGTKPDQDGEDFDTGDFRLSWNRAQYVYDYLVKKGIPAYRLSYKGYAQTKPLVYPEKTIKDQNKNRRVEVMVVSK
jgi:outer membrane protein OmpA-like peptidoglycan-associated protein